eukprot:s1_g806.t1
MISTREVDTYVPILNDEIALANEIAQEGVFTTLNIVAPHAENLRLCCDKNEQALWLKRLGVNVPTTSESFEEVSGGHLFVKPGNGFGSVSAEALPRSVVEGLDRSKLDGMVFQEICEAPEVTVDSFYDSNADYQQAICRERLETKSGVCTKARLFQDEALAEIALKIGRGLSQRGTICFQVMRLRGEWAVTDLNFRSGAGTAMTCAAGWDVLSAMFACQWGEPYEGPIALDLDGTLISCRERQVALFQAISAENRGSGDGDKFWAFKRDGLSTHDAALKLGLTSEDAAHVATRWVREIEDAYWLQFDSVYDDVNEFLRLLWRHDVSFFVLTARRNKYLLKQQILRLAFLSDTEIIVVTPQEAATQKAEVLRSRGAALFIGDSESDLKAAKIADVAFGAVGRGQRNAKFLMASGADRVSDSLLEILQAGDTLNEH